MAKKPGNILIVDDDDLILLSAQLLLEQHYSSVRKINNPEQIQEVLNESTIEVLLLDMNFRQGETSGTEGLKWLSIVKRLALKQTYCL